MLSQFGTLEDAAARELVRYAVGQHIFCPECQGSLDASEALLYTDTAHNAAVMCAVCYGRPIGHIRAGSVTVYDGRALFTPRSPRRTKGRKGAPSRVLEWRYAVDGGAS